MKPDGGDIMTKHKVPPHVRLDSALRKYALVVGTQSQQHIKPLHQHIATRLVIEGGFSPSDVTPHPPLAIERRGKRKLLVFKQSAQGTTEQTILGGLRTKAVDVVVTKPNIGPVIAISVKGTSGAFRNLTNRMEEAIGDSTNLHIMYPGLVYGFLHVLKAHRAGKPGLEANDFAITADGEVVQSIRRYHDVMLGLAGRRLVRDDYTRYEAVALALVESTSELAGKLVDGFPASGSPLGIRQFFDSVYRIYDLRFPYVAASVHGLKREIWDADSPAFATDLGYEPRIGIAEGDRSE